MKRKVKRPFDNEQFRKGYVAGIFAAEKELNTELLHFAEKAHKIMSEGTFPDYGVKINFKDSNNTITTNLDMKTEEKAKRYDEALEWMRELYPGLHGATKEDAEHYFPELAESEDEKMIGVICLALTDVPEERFTTEGTSLSEVLAWMEKQREQKPEWSEDERIRKVLVSIVKWLGFDSSFFTDNSVTKSEVLAWLEKQKEQKPEWSEKDEAMRDNILRVLSCFVGTVECDSNPSLSTSYPAYQKEIDWLKSLRPVSKESLQPHWKPSEEQMEALSETIEFAPDTFKPKCTLVTLQYDLKKLMEE